MLVLGLIVILGLILHLVNFWSKMQLPELMHQLGMHADTMTLAYAADGVHHIANTFANPVFAILYLVWLAALWFHLTHGFWRRWAGTTRYGSTAGSASPTSILPSLWLASPW